MDRVSSDSSDDTKNQKALLLAKAADPAGTRTIGVLTKPDTLIEEADKALWLAVAQNKKQHLNLGYYVSHPAIPS